MGRWAGQGVEAGESGPTAEADRDAPGSRAEDT